MVVDLTSQNLGNSCSGISSVSVGKMTGDMKMKISSAIDDIIKKEYNAVRKTMKRELKRSEIRVTNQISRLFGEQNQTYVGKLEFRNKISETILTGEEIKGEGNTCLEVALIDNNTGHVIDTGPQSSAIVEIVVIKGEFDACEGDTEFDNNIVGQVEGKNALLAGNVRVNLHRGIGVLQTIKFKHNTIKQNPPVFRLGARVVDSFEGTRVKEAKTEIFTVKDFRSKYYRKHDIPSLSDEVWRLQNIRKGGKVEQHLRDAKVCTVEDFLIQLLKNPQELKRNVNLGDKKWEATVNHARTCSFEERVYCYINSQQKTGIVFDLLGKGIALFKKGQYAPINMCSDNDQAHIDELLSSAFEHWEDIIPLQNKIELQLFTSSVTSGDPHDSFWPEHTDLHDKPEPSEMTGDKQLSSSLRGRDEPSVKEFSMDDVESVHNHPSCVPWPHTSLVTSGDHQDSFQPKHTGLYDKPGPSEMTGDKQLSSLLRGRGESSVKKFSMDDVESVHNHPLCAPWPHTSLVTYGDHQDSFHPEHTGLHDKPGPSDMTGDKQLSSSLRGWGEPSVKEFKMDDVESVHNHPSCVPWPHTSLVTFGDHQDSIQPEHTGLHDKHGPSEMTGDKQLSSSLRGRGEPSSSVDLLDFVQPEHTCLHDQPEHTDLYDELWPPEEYISIELEPSYPYLREPSASQLNTQHNGPIHSPGIYDQGSDCFKAFQNDNDYMEFDKPY